ncbi:MAG: hypothetical protein ABSG25_09405, partial [Bryobacteraceae bacterium]
MSTQITEGGMSGTLSPAPPASCPAPTYYEQIADRNSNTTTLQNSCDYNVSGGYITGSCTTAMTDDPGRSIMLNYGISNGINGTSPIDTITWPGNGTMLTASVDFAPTSMPSFQYWCIPDTTSVASFLCSTAVTEFHNVVESITLPPAQTSGQQMEYVFDYCQVGSTNPLCKTPNAAWWGELHSMQAFTSASAASQAFTSSASPLYAVNYLYYYDTVTCGGNSSGLGSPIGCRGPGTTTSPILQKTLTYNDIPGVSSSQAPPEVTNYCVTGTQAELTGNSGSAQNCGGTGLNTVITHPDNTTSQYFYNAPGAPGSGGFIPSGLIYQSVDPDGTITNTTWAGNPSLYSASQQFANLATNSNAYVQQETRTLPDGNQTKKAYAVDQNGNNLETDEYNWLTAPTGGGPGNPPPQQSPARSTITAYWAGTTGFWNTSAPHYLKAKQSTIVKDGSGNRLAETDYTYDNWQTTANLKSQLQWDSVSGNSFTKSWTYDGYGNLTLAKDANANALGGVNGNVTQYTYDPYSLYPVTKVEASNNSSIARKTTYVWPPYTDPVTGLKSELQFLTSATDSDNNVTTTYTYDSLGRYTGKEETATGLDRLTNVTYDDVGLSVTTATDRLTTNDQKLITETFYDPLGRVRLANANGFKVQKNYAYGTRADYELTSNPYAALTSNNTESTMGWTLTTTSYPTTGGRVTTAQHFAGGALPAAFGGNNNNTTGTTTTNYTGAATTVTDEAGFGHINLSDGLGRLASVTEMGATQVSGATPGGTVTNYGYDLLNNLTGVNMAGQTRSFLYSSLSRLLSATNPESGAIGYTYDPNGNLLTKTDAIGTKTTMAYDGLNRVTSKSYAAASPAVATPSVTYTYDHSGDTKGTLYSVTTSAGNGTTYTHDKIGRVTGSTQTTAGTSYPFTYQYSLTDILTQVGYPSGLTMKYVLDSQGNTADPLGLTDRITAVQDQSTQSTYDALSYLAPGQLSAELLGNGVLENLTWNDRLQQTSISVGSGNLLALHFYPCQGGVTQCANNNGNIWSQTISMPGMSGVLTQNYAYDALNRLTNASESGGTTEWAEGYGYDVWGNRWLASYMNVPIPTRDVPVVAASFSTNGVVTNRMNPAVNLIQYDSDGNATQIASQLMTYDAEDRQVTATGAGAAAQYVYDGEGRRVQKVLGGVTTNYVYDAQDQLAAEYAPQPAASDCGTPICYFTEDHLGSTRLVTDTGGNVAKRFDYLPFGEEIFAGVGGRTISEGYLSTPDPLNPKFTGKLRDNETGLDFFEARYFSGAQGRWTSPDAINLTDARVL